MASFDQYTPRRSQSTSNRLPAYQAHSQVSLDSESQQSYQRGSQHSLEQYQNTGSSQQFDAWSDHFQRLIPPRVSDLESQSERVSLSRFNGKAPSAVKSLRNMKTARFALPSSLPGRSAEQFTAGSSIFASRHQAEKLHASQLSPTSTSLPPSPQISQSGLDCHIKEKIEELSSTQAKFTETQDNFSVKVDEQSRVTSEISCKIDRLVAGMVSQEQILKLVRSVDTLTSQNRELIRTNCSLNSRIHYSKNFSNEDGNDEAAKQKKRRRNSEPSQPQKSVLQSTTGISTEDFLIEVPAKGHRLSAARMTAKSQSSLKNIDGSSSAARLKVTAPMKLTAGALALQAEETSQHGNHTCEPNFFQKEHAGNNQCKMYLQNDYNSCDEDGSEVLSVVPSSKKNMASHGDKLEQEFDGEQSPFVGDSSDEEESDVHVMDLNTWMQSTGRSRRTVQADRKADILKSGDLCSEKSDDQLQRGPKNNTSSRKTTSSSGCGNQAPNLMTSDPGGEDSCFLFRDEESDNDAGDLEEERNPESVYQEHKFFQFTTSSISQDF